MQSYLVFLEINLQKLWLSNLANSTFNSSRQVRTVLANGLFSPWAMGKEATSSNSALKPARR